MARDRFAGRFLSAPRRLFLALLPQAMTEAGLPTRPSAWSSPHVTLGYRRGEPFSRAISPISWQADRLVLIDSHLGLTRHDRLGEWRFTG